MSHSANLKLKKFRTEKKLTQAKMAKSLGISQVQIANIEAGKRSLTKPILDKLIEVYGLDLYRDVVLDIYNVHVVNHLAQKLSDTIVDDTIVEYKFNTPNKSSYPSLDNYNKNIISVPFYNAKASAGTGALLPEYEEKDIIYFDKRWLSNVIGIKEEHAVLIKADGDSMDSGLNRADDIYNGDLLLLDDSIQEFINNKIYVVRLYNSELYVKKVVKEWTGEVTLVSNNPNYPPMILKEESEATIIGKVCWNGSATLIK